MVGKHKKKYSDMAVVASTSKGIVCTETGAGGKMIGFAVPASASNYLWEERIL